MADNGLELSTLSNHLWESANILRGPVDAADFKTYIFPLLFFKRISDVFDEEVAEALAESDGDQQYALFPENHRFQIPDDCHWDDVRKKTSNVGQGLQRAMREIEKANPETLYGIFGDAQWTNKDRLSDALLRDLIEHFSKLPLGNKAARADVLGQSYEYLIKKFADATNKKAGEFYTPRSVVSLMVRILDPREGEAIYDPACGTGGMLIEAIHHVREAGGNIRTLWGKLYGQEKNLTTSAIARMNLFLHGVEDFDVVRGDTLRQPAFHTGDSLATFDCVIANPPFSLEKWGDDVWASDPYGRNFAGMPPAKSGDFAWVQHMVLSMVPKAGRMAVVLPHGALFRMGAEGKIREKLLGMDILDAVIGLGPNLFYGTGLAACILVFRQKKPKDQRKKVLIVEPAVADQITGDKWNRYIFRTARNSSQDALAAAATLKDEGISIATLAQDNAFGKDGIASLTSCSRSGFATSKRGSCGRRRPRLARGPVLLHGARTALEHAWFTPKCWAHAGTHF